jgi:hypothetical protein
VDDDLAVSFSAKYEPGVALVRDTPVNEHPDASLNECGLNAIKLGNFL